MLMERRRRTGLSEIAFDVLHEGRRPVVRLVLSMRAQEVASR